MSEMPEWLPDETIAVLLAAVDRDPDRAMAGLQRIGEAGCSAMYGACCAWAESVTIMAGWREVLGKDSDDGMLCLERLPGASKDESDPTLWVARFVTTVANKDHKTATALFDTTIDMGEEHHGRCVVELVALAGSVGRHKLAGGGGS